MKIETQLFQAKRDKEKIMWKTRFSFASKEKKYTDILLLLLATLDLHSKLFQTWKPFLIYTAMLFENYF